MCLSQSADSVLTRAKRTVFENKDMISERTDVYVMQQQQGWRVADGPLSIYLLFIHYLLDFVHILYKVCSKKVKKKKHQ